MPGPVTAAGFDEDRIAEVMQALGSPVRLRLLRLLRLPHAIGDIQVAPHRAEGGNRPTRHMAVASVREHLVQLLRIGVVQARRLVRGGHTLDHYEVNRPQLFALTEELRALADLSGSAVLDGTMPGPLAQPEEPPRTPHLVLVRGLGEGRAFVLDPERSEWIVGRDEGAQVRLDYDGYVSMRNTRIVRDSGRLLAQDIATSRNGTSVNWKLLPRGGQVQIQAGDVIGVGRSFLLLRVP